MAGKPQGGRAARNSSKNRLRNRGAMGQVTYPRPAVSNYRFPKNRRVTSSRDFTRILRRGGCAADGTLVVFGMQHASSTNNSPAPSRLGITVPKKVGSAPVRNRWKRLIREAYRTQPDAFPIGFDWIVRPKKGAHPDWRLIHQGLPRLASKAARRCLQAAARPDQGKTSR